MNGWSPGTAPISCLYLFSKVTLWVVSGTSNAIILKINIKIKYAENRIWEARKKRETKQMWKKRIRKKKRRKEIPQ